MAKVVTSAGLQEFVQEGKFDRVAPLKKGEAPPLETVKAAPTLEVSTPKEPEKAAPTPEPDEELTAEEKTLDAKAQKEIQRAKRAVNEKHRLMKEAQEATEEAERFAETQYNERTLAQKRADALEARLAELEKKEAPKQEEKKAPEMKDFTNDQGQVDWDKYTDAKADYRAEQAVQKERERLAGEQAEVANEAHKARIIQSAELARKAHPDFDKVMNTVHGTAADQVPQFVLNYMFESENTAEIAYHLAKNPEVSQKIAKMKPILGIAELGRLEDSLVKPPSAAANAPAANSVTPRSERGGAPAPITPLDGEGSAGVNTDPAKMSYKELRAYHRERREKHH